MEVIVCGSFLEDVYKRQDVFSTVMKKLGERNPKVVAITAAMADGTGLRRFHRDVYQRQRQ